MALLQDSEARLARENERREQRRVRTTRLTSGFLYLIIIAACLFVFLVLYLFLPNGRLGYKKIESQGELAKRLALLINQDPDVVLPTALRNLKAGLGEDFRLLITPSFKSTKLNQNVKYTVYVVRGDGFRGAVSLAVEGLPIGVTATVTPASVADDKDQAELQIAVASDAALGKYELTVTAKGEDREHTGNATLTVSNLSASEIVARNIRRMDEGTRWQATVSWRTDTAATSWVEYASQATYIQDALAYTFTSTNHTTAVTHEQTLYNLDPDTVYHFRIKSVDALSNIVVSDDAIFVTKAP